MVLQYYFAVIIGEMIKIILTMVSVGVNIQYLEENAIGTAGALSC